jgi:amidase
MHLESDGYHGRTLNPHNIHLSSGGSSGGESALVALRGSIMGVGTDIGGSIRAPCGFVGIYGFKPTADTLPTRDLIRGGMPAELNVLCSAGPMCTSLRDVDFFMRQILAQKPYIQDPRVVPIPWTGLTTKLDFSPPRRLRVGIMMNDGFIQPQPPVIRALREAKNRLQASQLCEVKPFTAYNTEEGYNLVRAMYFPDGGNSCNVACEATGEPIHLLSADGNSYAEPKDSDELTQVRAQRDSFRTASSENWAAHDIDVVLCPVHVGPAAAHDTGRHISYTAIWNALDCPGIVFPTGLVAGPKGTERYADNDDKAWNPTDADVRDLWMTHDYEGAPIALQLVARRHHDNMLIAALHLLEDALRLNE